MSWLPCPDEPSKLFCDVHDPAATARFAKKGAGCLACRQMRTPAIATVDTTVVVTAPEGCLSQAAHERRLTEAANYALEQAKVIRDDKERNSRPSESLSLKWMEVFIKATRAAAELGRAREELADTDKLEALVRKIHGGGTN